LNDLGTTRGKKLKLKSSIFRLTGIKIMNKFKMLVSAALVSAFFSSSALAVGVSPADKVTHPTSVVAPLNLPREYLGETIQVSFTIDASGCPSNIRIESHFDRKLARSVIPALAQWRFAPVVKEGKAISQRVELPIEFMVKA
jgi:TonB family protein